LIFELSAFSRFCLSFQDYFLSRLFSFKIIPFKDYHLSRSINSLIYFLPFKKSIEFFTLRSSLFPFKGGQPL